MPGISAADAARAEYLSERIRAGAAGTGTASSRCPDEWKRSAFPDDEIFERYLASHGTTETTVACVLHSAPPARENLPEWARELNAVVGGQDATPAHEGIEAVVLGTPYAPAPFSGLLARFTGSAMAAVGDAAADAGSDAGPQTRLYAELETSLASRLAGITFRALIADLHRCRKQGELRGETPELRYADYNERLLNSPSHLTRLFSAYPVLGRLLIEARAAWVRHVRELLDRVRTDRPELYARGWIDAPDSPLVSVQADSGDTHDGGRSVVVCEFEHGRRLVYKPRSVALDALYERAVAFVDDRSPNRPLMAPRVLERDGYGWTGFVEHRQCAPDRLPDYYRAVGSSVALAYFLGASDVHMENAVACGPHSVIVDLESLLQNREAAGGRQTAFARAKSLLNNSVLGIGYLPMRTGNGEDQQATDVSVIGGGLDDGTEVAAPILTEVRTDRMAVGRGRSRMGAAGNQPADPGFLRPADHAPAIADGFREVYDLIAADRDGFAAALGDTAGIPTRHLLRPTHLYGRFLYESCHPRYLQSALDREHLFDRLWATTLRQPELTTGVASEIRQLLRHDVPKFTAPVDGTALQDETGIVDAHHFSATAVFAVHDRLRQTGEADRAWHVRIIDESMSTLGARDHAGQAARPLTPRSAQDRSPRETAPRARAAAEEVLRDLDATRLDGADGRDCTWVGISPAAFDGAGFEYRPLSPMLFEGLAGMALAYTYASSVLGTDGYLDTARRCIRPVSAFVEDRCAMSTPPNEPVGAYSGYTGALYALLHYSAAVGGDPETDALIRKSVRLIPDMAEQDSYHDLGAGAAGAALVCLRLYHHYGDEHLLDLARDTAQGVASRARADGRALAWPTDVDGGHLGGMAHGASGIGWALIEVGTAAGDEELTDAGYRALAFDTDRFDTGRGWPDLRREVRGRSAFPVQWCHGAVGIGLVRELCHRMHPDAELAAEADAAVAAVAKTGVPPNDSLCHGTLGARELLHAASQRSVRAQEAEDGLNSTILDRFERKEAAIGIAGTEADSPGLMLGSAGFVLGLLRMAAPRSVPSVLSLEGPSR
ncbi:type 2 lanthipeptide synthetase LanM family protein [Streptomonospora litoralis]|uniref:Lanthionine synthetase C-like protein n=1 Tax=Streptomonospora litoralis TaxID=2498135 RepID=A0A4P6PY82_9ACTN|nr:type 2 lanthipeptide synthetase LanM family protein [Streptomonospora litoralis]QBI53073.1 Lanthionine synthetase C-like protein [Streptomonospora litoralis]